MSALVSFVLISYTCSRSKKSLLISENALFSIILNKKKIKTIHNFDLERYYKIIKFLKKINLFEMIYSLNEIRWSLQNDLSSNNKVTKQLACRTIQAARIFG